MKPILLLLLSIGSAYAGEPPIADTIASAPYVPVPSALGSMPSSDWCKVVDAALANPNITPGRREEYITTGQAQHCPHQIFMEPRKVVQQPATPAQWCAEAFKMLSNPAADQYLKAAVLEKARNRGCLR
jgi:hypothetical protein